MVSGSNNAKSPDSLQTIFDQALYSYSILSDPNPLASDYIPQHLPFRDDQLKSIAQTMSPVLRSTKPSNLLIYGKTGTGKTAVTKYVIQRLITTCTQHRIPARFLYANAKLASTEYRLLSDFAAGLGLPIPFTGLALGEVLSRITLSIDSKALQTILIIDEIDHLVRSHGDDLLYSLTTTSEKTSKSFISIVGISNDLTLKDSLGARVLSRLSEEELVFPPYSTAEIKQILRERIDAAFVKDSCTEAALNLCAALSGSEHGDARRALELLRVAAQVAQRESSTKLDERHIRIALQKIDQDRITTALSTLPLHAKIVLISSTSSASQPLSSGNLYQEYCSSCNKIGTDPLTTRRVSGLLAELDTLGLITANVVNYGRYGRTKKITLNISPNVLREAFSGDSLVQTLFT